MPGPVYHTGRLVAHAGWIVKRHQKILLALPLSVTMDEQKQNYLPWLAEFAFTIQRLCAMFGDLKNVLAQG